MPITRHLKAVRQPRDQTSATSPTYASSHDVSVTYKRGVLLFVMNANPYILHLKAHPPSGPRTESVPAQPSYEGRGEGVPSISTGPEAPPLSLPLTIKTFFEKCRWYRIWCLPHSHRMQMDIVLAQIMPHIYANVTSPQVIDLALLGTGDRLWNSIEDFSTFSQAKRFLKLVCNIILHYKSKTKRDFFTEDDIERLISQIDYKTNLSF